MSGLVHQCGDLGCPYFEQPSPKGCGCHKTDFQMLQEVNRELAEALRPFADIGLSANPDYEPMIRMSRDAIERARAALAKAGL